MLLEAFTLLVAGLCAAVHMAPDGERTVVVGKVVLGGMYQYAPGRIGAKRDQCFYLDTMSGWESKQIAGRTVHVMINRRGAPTITIEDQNFLVLAKFDGSLP